MRKKLIRRMQSSKWTIYDFYEMIDEYDDIENEDYMGFEWWKD